MTRKDLGKVIAKYFDLVHFGTKQLVTDETILEEIFSRDLAFIAFLEVAKQTQESSNIWVLVGGTNVEANDGKLERFYAFRDLETDCFRFVPSLEYYDFAKENTIILLDNAFSRLGLSKSANEDDFNVLRRKFFNDLATFFKYTDAKYYDYYCKYIEATYNNIVKQYKKLDENYQKNSRRSSR